MNVTGATAADLSIAFQTGFCPTGYTYDGTQCVNSCTPPADCPSAGTKKSASVALSGITGQAGISTTMCADSGGTNCGVSCSSGIASYNDVSGQSSVYCDSYTFTGSACSDPALVAAPVTGVPATNQATPVNSPPKTKQDCPGGSGFAEVNNVGMCLPSGTTYTGSSTTTTSTTGSVTTTSTTTVNQTGGNTTTTIKTHKDSGGNITYSGSTTDSPSINQLNSPGAGDKPSLGDAPTFDTTLPSEATFNIKAQGNPVFSTEIFASTASCPAPIAYAAMGQEFSIDFSGICALADIIRGIVLLLAAIVSMRSLVTN
ncbi:MAG: virulence factor TspB C-terminal domain-related protein [Gallionella sp.]|nr:virulence factor TspB C-terminal domain-related protein [Gallionella sp.]